MLNPNYRLNLIVTVCK
ncbi:Protein of unknown function [Lactobacillus delbrueckii subsp. lactis]|nr:Protein of unknown function [Lactobacillus delbrueckii subsp. lactis]